MENHLWLLKSPKFEETNICLTKNFKIMKAQEDIYIFY